VYAGRVHLSASIGGGVRHDNGYIQVEEIDVPPGKEEDARRGAAACPERIILIEEDPK
jgi:hypothetical protein